MTNGKYKILFMCVANSARSQLAEGLAKQIFGDRAVIESAGSEPKTPNAIAIEALKEIGIDISRNTSKAVSDLATDFVVDLDYVITLCAEEVCPVLPSRTAKKLHWPFPDPAGHAGNHEDNLERFRVTREAIRKRIEDFALSLTSSATSR
ncbi:MAG: arsenate reductase ArsC [Proteobacteria bacterium]|nr:MAG: arsenate reductase ArsC [Pseudomonadota bacterium]